MIPLWVRILHWAIAVLFLLLIISGITQHFATVQSSLINYSIATTLHELGGIVLSIVYVVFLLAIFITGYWRRFFPRTRTLWQLVWQQSQFYGRNPTTVFLVVPLLIITGLWYYFPDYAPTAVLGFDGLWTVAMCHYVIGVLATAYTIGHIFMAFFMRTLRKVIYGKIKIP